MKVCQVHGDKKHISIYSCWPTNKKIWPRGHMFLLEDEGAKAECAVTKKADGVYDKKSIAVQPDRQRIGDVPSTLGFYRKRGFADSHRIKSFFVDHYDHVMTEDGIQLIDMAYLKRERSPGNKTQPTKAPGGSRCKKSAYIR